MNDSMHDRGTDAMLKDIADIDPKLFAPSDENDCISPCDDYDGSPLVTQSDRAELAVAFVICALFFVLGAITSTACFYWG